MKNFIGRIKTIIRRLQSFDNKFQITKNSASLSFYILVSVVSILLILIQIIAMTNAFENFFLTRAIDIFTDSFSKELQALMPSFSLSGFSALLLINIIYSASRTINGYNRIADYIYFEIKSRVGWKNRISAFLMFSMLLIVFLFELSIIIFGNYLINNVLKLNYYVIKIIQFILEISLIYFTINILFIYVPPRRMSFKNTYKGALFSTGLIYSLLTIFILVINALKKYSVGITLLTLISYSLILIFVINYILIVGLIINYYGNISQLKTFFFSK